MPAPLPQPRTAAEAFLLSLKQAGVDYFFANPGTDFAPTSTLRVRYTVTDAGDGDVVEGAIDAVKFQTFECITPVDCPADVNGDGLASPADFTAWLSCFNDPGSAPFCDRADVNGSGAIDPADFTAWLGAFNAGCD